ncbi:AaceriAGR063Wp [[Ashbya] aceris (nom. inval.)]|nr:AaceriAGR063Wp [[Ashbya] aceris (nom. inval.)]
MMWARFELFSTLNRVHFPGRQRPRGTPRHWRRRRETEWLRLRAVQPAAASAGTTPAARAGNRTCSMEP